MPRRMNRRRLSTLAAAASLLLCLATAGCASKDRAPSQCGTRSEVMVEDPAADVSELERIVRSLDAASDRAAESAAVEQLSDWNRANHYDSSIAARDARSGRSISMNTVIARGRPV